MHKNTFLFAGLLCLFFSFMAVSCKKKKVEDDVRPNDAFSLSPAKGFPGREVTITGTGFSAVAGENVVMFNGAVASILSASSDKLVVRLPADGSTGPVVVKVNSVQLTGTPEFTYTGQPASTITGDCGGAAKPLAIQNFKINSIEKKDTYYIISFQFEVMNTGTSTVSMSNTLIQGLLSPDPAYGSDHAAGGAYISRSDIAPGEKVLFTRSANSSLLPDNQAIDGYYLFLEVGFDEAGCDMLIANELRVE